MNEQNHFTETDRISLSRLEIKQERLITDFEELRKTLQNSDHDKRIRVIENQVADFSLVKKVVYVFVGMILIAFVGSLIALIIK